MTRKNCRAERPSWILDHSELDVAWHLRSPPICALGWQLYEKYKYSLAVLWVTLWVCFLYALGTDSHPNWWQISPKGHVFNLFVTSPYSSLTNVHHSHGNPTRASNGLTLLPHSPPPATQNNSTCQINQPDHAHATVQQISYWWVSRIR